MINYRIGGRASGKTFRLIRQLSGKEYVFIEAYRYKVIDRKWLFKYNEEYNGYGDMSKAKVTTIFDYIMGDYNDVNIVVIEDFNDFISSIFRDKEVYININPKEQRVNFIDIEKESDI